MTTIEADRFSLVPLVEAHAAALFPVLADPALYRFIDGDPPTSLAALQAVFKRRESRRSPDGAEQWLNWGLRLTTGEWAGHLQATVFEPGTSWVAYVLATAHQGRGLGGDATRAMVEHLSETYGCERFLARVERAHERSIALLNRLSFQPATPAEHDAHGLGPSERLLVRRSASPA